MNTRHLSALTAFMLDIQADRKYACTLPTSSEPVQTRQMAQSTIRPTQSGGLTWDWWLSTGLSTRAFYAAVNSVGVDFVPFQQSPDAVVAEQAEQQSTGVDSRATS